MGLEAGNGGRDPGTRSRNGLLEEDVNLAIALAAGCDMVLLCNAPESAAELLTGLAAGAMNRRRAEAMRGARLAPGLDALRSNARFALARAELDRFAAAYT